MALGGTVSPSASPTSFVPPATTYDFMPHPSLCGLCTGHAHAQNPRASTHTFHPPTSTGTAGLPGLSSPSQGAQDEATHRQAFLSDLGAGKEGNRR